MHAVHLTFKINVPKMEHAFQMGYREGEKAFYVSLTNWKGKEEGVVQHTLVPRIFPRKRNMPTL
jgi:hypothetical protein